MSRRIDIAINELFNFATSGSPRDLRLDDINSEKHAVKFIDLAATFVSALDEDRGVKELRKRASRFSSLTEASKLYRRLRKAAYKRFTHAFEQAASDTDGELRVSQLRAHPKSEKHAHEVIVRWKVERFLGDVEYVLWFPNELREYCARLDDLLGWPELGEWEAYLYTEIHERSENLHLWGSFLLDAAHKAVQPTPDANRYGRLLETVKYWKWAVPAMRDAAVDLFRALPVDEPAISDAAAQTTAEAIMGDARGTGKTTTDTASDAAISVPEQLPPVREITVKEGHESFQLVARGPTAVSIDGKPFYALFMLFAIRLAKDASEEIVPWEELNKCVDENDTTSKQASKMLRRFILDLRKKLAKLGCPPKGKYFIVTKTKQGCHLNASCEWKPDKAVRKKYSRLSESVSGRLTDPQTMAKNTPDDDHDLPAQPKRPSQHHPDDDAE
jgi:hypothetical protein